MRQAISGDIGFTVTDRIQIYETEPAEPPEKSCADTIFSLHLFAPTMTNRPNQSMKPTPDYEISSACSPRHLPWIISFSLGLCPYRKWLTYCAFSH